MTFVLYLSCKSRVSKERNVNVWKLTIPLNWKKDYKWLSQPVQTFLNEEIRIQSETELE